MDEKVPRGRRIEKKLSAIAPPDAPKDGVVDQRWYWAALALLDRQYTKEVSSWLNGQGEGWASIQAGYGGDTTDGFRQHIELFVQAFGLFHWVDIAALEIFNQLRLQHFGIGEVLMRTGMVTKCDGGNSSQNLWYFGRIEPHRQNVFRTLFNEARA
jgi:hypothetical protein